MATNQSQAANTQTVNVAKKKNAPKWTPGEEDILVENVRKHPDNLSHAFQITAVRIGRSKPACAQHWYDVVSKGNHTPFFFGSTKGVVRNRKNPKKSSKGATRQTVSIYQKLLKLLGFNW